MTNSDDKPARNKAVDDQLEPGVHNPVDGFEHDPPSHLIGGKKPAQKGEPDDWEHAPAQSDSSGEH